MEINISKSKREKNNKNNNQLNYRDKTEIDINKTIGRYDHDKCVERLMLEREHFNQDPRSSTTRLGNSAFDEYNNEDDDEDYARGMPKRSQYKMKKSGFENNPRTDFDLMEKVDTTNIKQYDPKELNTDNDFADVSQSMNRMTTQLKPLNMCSNGIEKIGKMLFDNILKQITNQNFQVNCFGIYSVFASLFMISSSTTEIELKHYFDFPKRETLREGLLELIGIMSKLEPHIIFKNLFLLDTNIPRNEKYLKYITFSDLVKIDNKQQESEAILINHYVDEIMQTKMRRTAVVDTIDNLQLVFVTLLKLNPIIDFDEVIKGNFINRKMYFIKLRNSVNGYFEDDKNKILEIKCNNGYINMGFITTKKNIPLDVDMNTIKFYIDKLKEIPFDEINIPVIQEQSKIKYTNILKETNLNSVFTGINANQAFPESLKLQDVLQNITINYVKRAIVKENEYNTMREITFDKEFLYYFRLVQTNTIIVIGYFC
jgi:hypothetical protein